VDGISFTIKRRQAKASQERLHRNAFPFVSPMLPEPTRWFSRPSPPM